MPKCKKCNESFPNRLKIDGKYHVLRSRKYCLICSPFGKHNTKQIELNRYPNGGDVIICRVCDKPTPTYQTNGWRKCYVCYQREREVRVRDKVHSIVGDACWKCSYSKGKIGRKVLDFHHVDPAKKLFSLHVRNMTNLSWTRIFAEMQKCALLCCRCHREFEVGIISQEEIEKIYTDKWKQILPIV
jgi:hypothetical protein